ncbi:MAG: ABC transporter substrate-binding protein [Thermoleophilia bacterium]
MTSGDHVIAAAVLPLSGRYAVQARQAERGLRAWAEVDGAELEILDAGDDPRRAVRLLLKLADTGRARVLFGPYGSGAMRAVAQAFRDRPEVIWNHGGAAVPRTGARVMDILGPAHRYWAGLAAVLGEGGVPLDRVVVVHAQSEFGRQVAAGAVDSLRGAGHEPLWVGPFEASTAPQVAARARMAGATAVVGCGRFEDDIALARHLPRTTAFRPAVGLVAFGVEAARDALGDEVEGGFGPCQWLPSAHPPPPQLDVAGDYPAAQAMAAGLIARRVIAAAGSTDADAMWDAARALRTATFYGAFAVDALGRQLGHQPVIVRWAHAPEGLRRVVAWEPEPGGGPPED